MTDEHDLAIVVLLALVRKPDEIRGGGDTITVLHWSGGPAHSNYDVFVGRDGWFYSWGPSYNIRKTEYPVLIEWFSSPDYRKKYGLDKC